MIALTALIAAFLMVGVSIVLGGDPAGFWSASSAILVILGTLAVTAIGLRRDDVALVSKTLPRALADGPSLADATARHLIDLALRMRRDGPHVLDAAIRTASPSLKQALTMVSDGLPPEAIQSTLEAEAELSRKRATRFSELARRAADVAPAMGLIGTLIGLVQMLGALSTPEAIGPAMAVALLTTLYGAVLAHLFFLPLAQRAEDQAEADYVTRLVCAAGVSALARRDHPIQIESQLKALLPVGAV
jgi:chemotaxis protein MotA